MVAADENTEGSGSVRAMVSAFERRSSASSAQAAAPKELAPAAGDAKEESCCLDAEGSVRKQKPSKLVIEVDFEEESTEAKGLVKGVKKGVEVDNTARKRLSEASTAVSSQGREIAVAQKRLQAAMDKRMEAIRSKFQEQQQEALNKVMELQQQSQELEREVQQRREERIEREHRRASLQSSARRLSAASAMRRHSTASQAPLSPSASDTDRRQSMDADYNERDWMAEQRMMLLEDLYPDEGVPLTSRVARKSITTLTSPA